MTGDAIVMTVGRSATRRISSGCCGMDCSVFPIMLVDKCRLLPLLSNGDCGLDRPEFTIMLVDKCRLLPLPLGI